VAELNREEMRRLARLGAQARLVELKREEAIIRRAFPELFRAGTRPLTGAKANADRGPRRRSRMSPAARKAVSERMKKYWAERRKAKK
jgi:hypothetical protein